MDPLPSLVYTLAYAMRRSVSTRELRESLAEIVSEVEAGGEIEITRHGKPVAVVISPVALRALRDKQASGFAAAYDRFLRTADVARHGVDRELLLATRERPASPGAR